MSENYKKFQHKDCEYFPCHKNVKEEDYNCLFCYCPLYMLKDKCGGNYKFAYGVKDCSECTIPHGANSYVYVMSKMGEVMEIGSDFDAE